MAHRIHASVGSIASSSASADDGDEFFDCDGENSENGGENGGENSAYSSRVSDALLDALTDGIKGDPPLLLKPEFTTY